MVHNLALIPRFLDRRGNKVEENILSLFVGVLSLAALAQIAIPLSWTPVPITGQTFGVALTALLWGRKRAMANILVYLTLGGLGLPIFSLGSSGLSFGPTLGYLIGMVAATYCIGTLSDLGWTKKWSTTYFATLIGSAIVFAFGVIGLSVFIPFKNLLVAGVLPFLPGDLIKSLLASFIAYRLQNTVK